MSSRTASSPALSASRASSPAEARPSGLAGPVRALLALGSLGGALGVAVVLLLSDRAPRLGEKMKDFVIEVGMSFESVFGVDWVDRSSVPGTYDQIGHAVLWFSVTVLVALTLRRWVPVLASVFFVASVSVLLEVLQGSVTSTRAVEGTDVVANLVGITAGLLLVLFVGLLVDVVLVPLKKRW